MKKILYILLTLALTSCTVAIPENATQSTSAADVFPDNDGATIPPNIAPMNFRIDTEADAYITHIYSDHDKEGIVVDGKNVDIDIDKWKALLDGAKGSYIYTEIYTKNGGQWTQFPAIKNMVAEENADEFVTYRLIQPSYIDYEDMYICQRNITCFDEEIIYDNKSFSEDESTGQCVNCHSCQDYNREGRTQMHLRQNMGGTLISDGDKVHKINLKTDSILSAGVYPAWHPTLPLIAYSVNSTGQVFHTRDTQKVEVIDYGSDMILYDINSNRVFDIDCDPDEYETFPAWSPDGKTLYYCSAYHHQTTDDIDNELNSAYDSLYYNIYARDFDSKTMKFGERRLVFDAASIGKSASQPRVSPDGSTLLFTLADYGQFHIWHHTARLHTIVLSPAGDIFTETSMSTQQDDQQASFHSWSSNGRWILFASRRIDGNYSRLYIAYYDTDGKMHKPLLLPQERADLNDELFRSFNAPEWMVRPVEISDRLRQAAHTEAKPADYAGSALLIPTPKRSESVKTIDAETGATKNRIRLEQ